MSDPDPEWKIVQAFCNRILKDGMQREAQQINDARDRVRTYRLWLKHRCKTEWKDRED